MGKEFNDWTGLLDTLPKVTWKTGSRRQSPRAAGDACTPGRVHGERRRRAESSPRGVRTSRIGDDANESIFPGQTHTDADPAVVHLALTILSCNPSRRFLRFP